MSCRELEAIARQGWREAQDATMYATYRWSQWWHMRYLSFAEWSAMAQAAGGEQ